MHRFIFVVILALLSGCCVGGDTRKLIEDNIAINAGHMRDDGLPKQAREIATANHDALWAILYREGCVDDVPAEVRERKQAREGGGGQ